MQDFPNNLSCIFLLLRLQSSLCRCRESFKIELDRLSKGPNRKD